VGISEKTMPHVIVKMYAGRSTNDKQRLAEEITKTVKTVLNYGDDAISVGIEDVDPADWTEKVYRPDILSKPKNIYKKPGYDPLK
jgi:4-oxalocrotonate tautomerase